MGYKMKKRDMTWLHNLKEFKLQAEKHLCGVPVIEQTYIYIEGHLLIFHWNKKREKIHSSFIPELIEDKKGYNKLVVAHLVAPWQLSHGFLSSTSHLVQTLEKCPHFHCEFEDLTINITN